MSFSLESILASSPHAHAQAHAHARAHGHPAKTSVTPSHNTHHTRDNFASPENQNHQHRYNPAFHNHQYRPHPHGQFHHPPHFHQLPPISQPPYRCPHSAALPAPGHGSVAPAQLLHQSQHSNSNARPTAQPSLNHQNQSQPQSHPFISSTQDRQNYNSQIFSEEDYSSEPYSEFTLDSPFPYEAINDTNDASDNINNDESDTYSSHTEGEDDDEGEEEEQEDNPSINFGYGTSFLSNFIDPRPSNPSPHNPPPTMTPPRARKRSIIQLDLDDGPSTSATGAKRRRTSISRPSSNRTPVKHTRSIEEVDLTAEDDPINVTLQKQRAEAVKAQQQSPNGHKSKLSTLQCTVCLDTPTDLTATACGHTFCRQCLMNWLMAGEKEPQRRPNCPACRKPLKRTSKTDTIPLEIMKRPVR